MLATLGVRQYHRRNSELRDDEEEDEADWRASVHLGYALVDDAELAKMPSGSSRATRRR